jgi:hypothetical protein
VVTSRCCGWLEQAYSATFSLVALLNSPRNCLLTFLLSNSTVHSIFTYYHTPLLLKRLPAMRLLHIQRDEAHEGAPLQITLCEFIGSQSDIPRYAILSHRWREEEVLFADMMGDISAARAKNGFQKLEVSCKIALDNRLQYIWCDTCCIDKSSSAELSEAINSMYEYYANSVLCIAYLDDIEDAPEDDSYLNRATWFSRGWTLQELVAPKHMTFYSQGWHYLGTKKLLAGRISGVLGIAKLILTGYLGLDSVCVSEKMSWAAQRTTTRAEDSAYSLMGLFGVHMPPLHVIPNK